MKQTNYQLFDFLDFDPELTGDEVLWKACAPVSISTDGPDVILEIPFQKHLLQHAGSSPHMPETSENSFSGELSDQE